MSFKDFQDIADLLELPINGKTYRIPAIGINDGVELMRMQEAITAGEDVADMSNDEFGHKTLGAAYDDMMRDNVPLAAVNRAAMTALADFLRGRTVAEIMWETGGDPKAVAAMKPQDHRTKAPTTRPRASGTTRKTNPKQV